MPGPVLHLGAVVACSHGGQAMPAAPDPRVLVSGQPVTVLTTPYTVAGCPFSTPCATAQWVTGATRVSAGGVPVLLLDSQGICAPTGVPLRAVTAQTRVVAT